MLGGELSWGGRDGRLKHRCAGNVSIRDVTIGLMVEYTGCDSERDVVVILQIFLVALRVDSVEII